MTPPRVQPEQLNDPAALRDHLKREQAAEPKPKHLDMLRKALGERDAAALISSLERSAYATGYLDGTAATAGSAQLAQQQEIDQLQRTIKTLNNTIKRGEQHLASLIATHKDKIHRLTKKHADEKRTFKTRVANQATQLERMQEAQRTLRIKTQATLERAGVSHKEVNMLPLLLLARQHWPLSTSELPAGWHDGLPIPPEMPTRPLEELDFTNVTSVKDLMPGVVLVETTLDVSYVVMESEPPPRR